MLYIFRKQWQSHICMCWGKMDFFFLKCWPTVGWVRGYQTHKYRTEHWKIIISDPFVSLTPHEHSQNMAFSSWNKILSPPIKPEYQPTRKERKIKGLFQTIKCHLDFVFNMSLSNPAERNSTFTQKRPLSVVLIPVVRSPDNQGSRRTSHSLCVADQVILFLWVCFFLLKKNGFTSFLAPISFISLLHFI